MDIIEHPSVLLTCFLLYAFLYGTFIILVEATYVYSCISFIIIPILLFILIQKFSLPKPNNSVVRDVLGVDIWNQHREKQFNLLNNISSKCDQDELTFRTIAHRAAGLDAPENSLLALRLCKEKGCNFVEIDLSLTKDNVPIVFHDDTLERMIGIPGNVEDYTWDEIKHLDLIFQSDSKEKKLYNKEKIPTFDEFINLCMELDIRVFIDIKDSTYKVVQVILDAYQKYPSLYKHSIVTSFNPIILYKIREEDPKIVCSMAWRPQYFSRKSYNPYVPAEKRCSFILNHLGAVIVDVVTTFLFNTIAYYVVGFSAVLLHKDHISPYVVSKWQNRNVRVIAWTVNSKLEKDFFTNGLNISYMTDTLDYNHLRLSGDK